MTAEGRTQRAISITRTTLKAIIDDPEALIYMAGNDVAPETIEDTVAYILEYLEKTSPEANKNGVPTPRCVCGTIMVKIADGDEGTEYDFDPIFICRKCRKILAEGWKWG